jgi:hypothetical protein
MDKLNLSHLRKCDQHWNKMETVKEGRFCEQCSKVMHDFRGKSNQAVNEKHVNSNEVVCGIYSSHQLRQLQSPLRNKPKSIPAVALGISGLVALSSPNTNAQEVEKPKTEIRETDESRAAEVKHHSNSVQTDSVQTIIQGFVFEETRGEKIPLPFANVFIENTEIGSQTDFDGLFSIDVSELAHKQDSVTLIVQMIGYEKVRQKVPLTGGEIIRINTSLSGDVTAFYVTVQPWYVRFWNRVKNFFYRITHF